MAPTSSPSPSSSMAHPPEQHYGYICCNCKVSGFVGRRYACWLCIGYQLCGSCYDSGQWPDVTEHKYYHPMEVHYTRAEYELYFGGEPYVEASVPQSYKCALCDLYGFTSMQLYKHLSDVHRAHKDFEEYFSILYARCAADAPINSVQAATTSSSGSASASASAFLRSVPSVASVQSVTRQQQQQQLQQQQQQQSSANFTHRCLIDPNVSFGAAVRMTQARRAALVEQQALNVLEELRLGNANSRYYMTHRLNALMLPPEQYQQQHQQLQQQQQQHHSHHSHHQLLQYQQSHHHHLQQQQQQLQQPPLDARAMRAPKMNRVRGLPPAMRLGHLFPKPNGHLPRRSLEDDWVSFWANSATLMEQEQQLHHHHHHHHHHQQHHQHQHQHRAERLLSSYADILREIPAEPRYMEREKEKSREKNRDRNKDKANGDKADKNKFLCLQFVPLSKAQELLQPFESQRVHFIEALLCSMLADEELIPVTLQPDKFLKRTKCVESEIPKQPNEESNPSSGNRPPVGIMDRFYKNLDLYNKWLAEFATRKQEKNSKVAAVPDMILQATHDPVVDIDSDMDPDTDERDEEDEVTGVGQNVSGTNDKIKIATVNVGDELSECEVVGEEEEEEVGEVDADDVEDEDEDDYDDNTGSETSDSTIAMLVNEIDQVYGY